MKKTTTKNSSKLSSDSIACIFQALLEANRYLIKHLDVCGLNPPKKTSDIPELK